MLFTQKWLSLCTSPSCTWKCVQKLRKSRGKFYSGHASRLCLLFNSVDLLYLPEIWSSSLTYEPCIAFFPNSWLISGCVMCGNSLKCGFIFQTKVGQMSTDAKAGSSIIPKCSGTKLLEKIKKIKKVKKRSKPVKRELLQTKVFQKN